MSNQLSPRHFTRPILLLMAFVFWSTFAPARWISDQDVRPDYKGSNPETANISEEQFKDILQYIQEVYTPIVARLGGKLNIVGDWKNEKPNAWARQMMGKWEVTATGGLARHADLSADGFALIICHELGHHLGGFAFGSQTPIGGAGLSNEGQADYFATHACAKQIWAQQNEINAEFRKTASTTVKEKCANAWTEQSDQDLCYRVLTGIESVIKTMTSLSNKPMADFNTPDPNVVRTTFHKHPAPQCRMDTSLQGALCQAFFDSTVIPGKLAPGGSSSLAAEKESASFTCMQYSGYSQGLRPACWFKAKL